MTTYIEAYETARDILLPGGWDAAGTGERYPGDFHHRAFAAVQELWNYLERTWDFWKLESGPDMDDVIGRYNSLWDVLAYQPAQPEPEPAPEPSAGPAPDTGSPSTDVDETAILDTATAFYESDQPTQEIVAAFEDGEQGETGPPVEDDSPADPATPGPLVAEVES